MTKKNKKYKKKRYKLNPTIYGEDNYVTMYYMPLLDDDSLTPYIPGRLELVMIDYGKIDEEE